MKATFRRVIIYMLIFSLIFTSVSTAVVRPVEVQASSGVMEGWEIFVGILSNLGFFSSSSSKANTYYDQFMTWVNDSVSFDAQVENMFSTLADDLVSNGVEQSVANHMQHSLVFGLVQLFDRGLFTSSEAQQGSFEYNNSSLSSVTGVITYELSKKHIRMVANYEQSNIAVVFECDLSKFVVGRNLSIALNGNIFLADKAATEQAIKTYSLNLVNFLKNVIANWLSVQTKQIAENRVFVKNEALGAASTAKPSDSVEDPFKLKLFSTQLLLLSHNFYKVFGLNDFAATASTLFASDESGMIEAKASRMRYKFPDSCIMTFVCSFPSPSIIINLTEDLSGYSLVYDNGLKKVDSNGSFSAIKDYSIACAKSSDNSIMYLCGYKLDFKFMGNAFEDYIDLSDRAFFYYVVDYDLHNYYSSVANYKNGISYEEEAKQYYIYGSTDYAADSTVDVYVPDATVYDDIVKDLDSVSSDNLSSTLDAAKTATDKAAEKSREEATTDTDTNSGSGSSSASDLLQKILNAILALDSSIATRLPLDIVNVINSFAGTADVIGDIDKLLNQKLPVIGSMADVVSGSLPAINDIKDWAEKVATPSIDSIAKSGLDSLKAIDTWGDRIVDAITPISLLDKLDGTLDGIALDNAKLLENIEKTVNGEKALTVSIAPSVQDPDDQDDFNLGFFNLFYLLFLILFKIIMIFCHCLELLFTIHSVQAYPYFLNNGMVQGLNWIKSVKIIGELLNVSLYDFLYVLVRIILVFSVVRLIRHYTDRLN